MFDDPVVKVDVDELTIFEANELEGAPPIVILICVTDDLLAILLEF